MRKAKSITDKQADGVVYWLSDRHKVLFALLLQTGLRVSDGINLKVKDVNQVMFIKEIKTKKERVVSVTDPLLRNLKQLCSGKNDSDYVFHSSRDASKHMHRTTFHRQIKKALLWLDFDCSAHSTRKLFAMNAFRETGSISKVQEILKHKYITTTAAYLNIDIEKLIREAKPS